MERFRHYITILLTCILCACATEEHTAYSGLGRIVVSATIISETTEASDSPISLTITSASGQYSHTWPDIKQFSSDEPYYVGQYEAKAVVGEQGSEGFGCPCYLAREEFTVVNNQTTDIDLVLTLTQAKIYVRSSEELKASYTDVYSTLHSAGHGFIPYAQSQPGPAYITPGATTLSISLTDSHGQSVSIAPDFTIKTYAAESYYIDLGIEGETLTVSCGDITTRVPITAELFNSEPPTIQNIGFTDNVPVTITEGYPAPTDLKMQISTPAGLKSLMLTVNTSLSDYTGLPTECNLLETDLSQSGLEVDTSNPNIATVDFTPLLESLSVNENIDLSFTLQAFDYLDRVSAPSTLMAKIQSVALATLHVDKAPIGIDTATILIAYEAPNIQVKDFSIFINDPLPLERPIEILSYTTNEAEHTVAFTVKVPPGIHSVPIKVNYMGATKLYAQIDREVPEYQLSVDPFASLARIRIIAKTLKIVSALTEYADISIKDTQISILERDTEAGLLVCSGLSPKKKYQLTMQVIPKGPQQTCTFTTESAVQIPDGDLENYRDRIDYKHLASGGIYSSTTFPIYNQQNYVDVKVSWSKDYWASVNKKTFCTKATNKNTWYMQPSSYLDREYYATGGKSACMRSVGWSLNGEELAPYLQEEGKYQPYSNNAPAIDKITAGVLFLGAYGFDPANATESSTQGIDFTSRPSSLNGYFRYVPDAGYINDRGWGEVQLLNTSDGTERVIAHGRIEFSASASFKTFNIPLIYDIYDLKPTTLRIIFCSSVFSTGIGDDNLKIPVTANIAQACYIGSQLWIDSLTFSY